MPRSFMELRVTGARFLTQMELAFSLIVSFEGRIREQCPKGPSNPTTGAAQRRMAFVREWLLKMGGWCCNVAAPRGVSGSHLLITKSQ